jgi:hypothetical protein
MQRDDRAPEGREQGGGLKNVLRAVSKRKQDRSAFSCSVVRSKMKLVKAQRRREDDG